MLTHRFNQHLSLTPAEAGVQPSAWSAWARAGDGGASQDTRLDSTVWVRGRAGVQGLSLDPGFRRGER